MAPRRLRRDVFAAERSAGCPRRDDGRLTVHANRVRPVCRFPARLCRRAESASTGGSRLGRRGCVERPGANGIECTGRRPGASRALRTGLRDRADRRSRCRSCWVGWRCRRSPSQLDGATPTWSPRPSRSRHYWHPRHVAPSLGRAERRPVPSDERGSVWLLGAGLVAAVVAATSIGAHAASSAVAIGFKRKD